MEKREQGAAFLFDLRMTHKVVPGMPQESNPTSLNEAYQTQEILVDQLLSRHGGKTVGYKVACTNRSAQELLKVDGPFYGCLLSATTYRYSDSPINLAANEFTLRAIEAEFTLEIGWDIPSRPERYSTAEIAPFIKAVMPSIEIVHWRYEAFGPAGGLAILADNAIHGAHVIGEPVSAEWTGSELDQVPVRLFVNGELQEEGGSQNVMGSPFNVLAFLIEELAGQGRMLKAGDLVTTGVTTDIYMAEAGDTVRADFDRFGQVEVTFR
ncbi:MAG: fumarylacetoacetate hydrolase family protein [Chloroflexota bacterium]